MFYYPETTYIGNFKLFFSKPLYVFFDYFKIFSVFKYIFNYSFHDFIKLFNLKLFLINLKYNDRMFNYGYKSVFENVYLNEYLNGKYNLNNKNYLLFFKLLSSRGLDTPNNFFFSYKNNPFMQYYIYNYKDNSFYNKNSKNFYLKNLLVNRKLNFKFTKSLKLYTDRYNIKLPFLFSYRDKHNLELLKFPKWDNSIFSDYSYTSKTNRPSTFYESFPHFVKYKTLYDLDNTLHDREYNKLNNYFFNENIFINRYPYIKSYNLFDSRFDYRIENDNIYYLKNPKKRKYMLGFSNYNIYKLKAQRMRSTFWYSVYKRIIYRTTNYFFSFYKKNDFNLLFLRYDREFFFFPFFSKLIFFFKYNFYFFFYYLKFLKLFFIKFYNYIVLPIYTFIISFFFFNPFANLREYSSIFIKFIFKYIRIGKILRSKFFDVLYNYFSHKYYTTTYLINYYYFLFLNKLNFYNFYVYNNNLYDLFSNFSFFNIFLVVFDFYTFLLLVIRILLLWFIIKYLSHFMAELFHEELYDENDENSFFELFLLCYFVFIMVLFLIYTIHYINFFFIFLIYFSPLSFYNTVLFLKGFPLPSGFFQFF